jgi:hypothetical protein
VIEPLPQDVLFEEQLAYQNVVSRRAKFHYGELDTYLQAFVSDVVAQGATLKEPCFYSLNNVPMDEMTDVEFFLPINESSFVSGEGMRFHSYFEVFPTVRGTVTGDFETRTEYVYALLLASLERRGWEVNAPFFHVFPADGSPYVSVYLGHMDPTDIDD